MHSTQRQMEIVEELKILRSCRVQELAQRLSVTEETIRRNVKQLAKRGLVEKVHGGVLLPEAREPTFIQRMDENPAAKERIARHVASLIHNGDSLILDIGSTTAYVARALCKHTDLLVVTNSVAIANILATRTKNRVFMAGGGLRPHDAAAFGVEALTFIRKFNVRYAVISLAALDAQKGFLVHDLSEAEFTREIIARAETTIVAADSTKFGNRAPIRVCDPQSIDILVTDAPPSPEFSGMLEDADIKVEIA